MLAGNVTVAVVDGVLRIHGDNASNSIEIQQLEQSFEGQWPGARYKIIGHNTGTHVRTAVNETSSIIEYEIGTHLLTTINGNRTFVIVEGVKNGINIFLRGGDNRLQIGDPSAPGELPAMPGRITDIHPPTTAPAQLPGRVQIGTWNGDDEIRLSVSSAGGMTLKTGPGGDDVFITRSRFENYLNMDLGAGDNYSKFTGSVALNGPTNIRGGGDADILEVSAVINGDFQADLADGRDQVSVYATSTTVPHIELGSGDDRATARTEWLAGITLDGGSGTDFLASDSQGTHTLLNFEWSAQLTTPKLPFIAGDA